MKLRLNGDSIRLRLGRGEVQHLLAAGSVAGQTRFGPGSGTLRYTLEASAGASAVSASFDGGQLRVAVPADQAHRWAGSADQVGITANQDAGDGHRLTILIEKDFECLHGAVTQDAFPNPEASAAR